MDFSTLQRSVVIDGVLRGIHAWNGLILLGLLITGELASLFRFEWPVSGVWRAHFWFGYGLVLGMVARFVWAVVGPDRARFANFWQPYRWLEMLRINSSGQNDPNDEYTPPLAALFFLMTYLAVGLAICSGLGWLAIRFAEGPLYFAFGLDFERVRVFKLIHQSAEKWFWLFIPLHFVAMWWHEYRHGIPVAQGMISGYHYRP